MEIVNWGIIGPGSIAHQFAKALEHSEQGTLYAVASRNKQRGQEFADLYGSVKVFEGYEAIINDPQVHVIYIATPHSHHYKIAKACLNAGKHVLLEKPLTINAQQTEELVKLSQATQCVFQEALWSRFMPCFATVKQWIANGEIGHVQYITSQIGFPFLERENHRLNNSLLGGGAILDLGVYSVSLSQFLLGEHPLLVQAMGHVNRDGVDQNTLVNMQYPSGVFSQFVCTIGAQCSNVMSIHGTHGMIHIPSMFWNGNQATLLKTDQQPTTLDFPHPINGFEYQIESTMESISTGRLCDPRMNHLDSLNVLHTLDEIRSQMGLHYVDEIESVDCSD